MGPCAKRQVSCVIVAPNGKNILGRNDCNNPQATCPRTSGEDYTKCRTICDQPGHAEVMAVAEAERLSINIKGARARLFGIDWICNHCRQITTDAGIERIYCD